MTRILRDKDTELREREAILGKQLEDLRSQLAANEKSKGDDISRLRSEHSELLQRTQSTGDEAVRKLTARLTSTQAAADEQRATLVSQHRQQVSLLEQRVGDLEAAGVEASQAHAKAMAEQRSEHRAIIEKMDKEAADIQNQLRSEIASLRTRFDEEVTQLRRDAADRAAQVADSHEREIEVIKTNAAIELQGARDRHRRDVADLDARIEAIQRGAADAAAAAENAHKAAVLQLVTVSWLRCC